MIFIPLFKATSRESFQVCRYRQTNPSNQYECADAFTQGLAILIRVLRVNFLFSHVTSKGNDEVLSASQVLVQHLCTKCPERAEYRSIVAKVSGIAGFQCHAIQNKNQNHSIDEVQKTSVTEFCYKNVNLS